MSCWADVRESEQAPPLGTHCAGQLLICATFMQVDVAAQKPQPGCAAHVEHDVNCAHVGQLFGCCGATQPDAQVPVVGPALLPSTHNCSD